MHSDDGWGDPIILAPEVQEELRKWFEWEQRRRKSWLRRLVDCFQFRGFWSRVWTR